LPIIQNKIYTKLGNISTEGVRNLWNGYITGTDMVHIPDILKKFGTVKMETYPFVPYCGTNLIYVILRV
jgi:hypothetical protein